MKTNLTFYFNQIPSSYRKEIIKGTTSHFINDRLKKDGQADEDLTIRELNEDTRKEIIYILNNLPEKSISEWEWLLFPFLEKICHM